MCCHPAITLSCLCVRNEATTGGQFTKLDRPTGLLLAVTKQLYEWFRPSVRPSVCLSTHLSHLFTPQPSGLEGYCRHGPGGWAGGCQICGIHISVTAWWIFSIRSSVELSRPLVVHGHGHSPICPIWACPWAKNLSNLSQIGSRLCGSHISETAGWIYPI